MPDFDAEVLITRTRKKKTKQKIYERFYRTENNLNPVEVVDQNEEENDSDGGYT